MRRNQLGVPISGSSVGFCRMCIYYLVCKFVLRVESCGGWWLNIWIVMKMVE